MPDLTTAQRLATYREELRAAGFTNSEVWQLVEQAAPSLPEDVLVNVEPQPVTFGLSRRPKTEEAAREAVAVLNAQQAIDRATQHGALAKRTIRVVGDHLRVEDEFVGGKTLSWEDSKRIEIQFAEDGGFFMWNVYHRWPPPEFLGEPVKWVPNGLISEDGAPTNA